MSNLLNRSFLLFCMLLAGLLVTGCGNPKSQKPHTAAQSQQASYVANPISCDGLAVEPHEVNKVLREEYEQLYAGDCIRLLNPTAEQIVLTFPILRIWHLVIAKLRHSVKKYSFIQN